MKTDLILVLFGFPAIVLAYAWFVYWMHGREVRKGR